jgi:glucosamine-6-phosphate deaminase
MIAKFKRDLLRIQIYNTRIAMGNYAAHLAAKKIRYLLEIQDTISIIFAAAPSQNEFLAALSIQPNIDWSRIIAFHMDEYVGLPIDSPQGFGNFLKRGLFDKVPFCEVHYLNGNATDLEQECLRYAGLLNQFPPDVVCMGIGENTHIAFNDPHVAKLDDPEMVKIVDLDQTCRQQQVNDGCFKSLEQVPTHAFTLTVPTLLRTKSIFCMVPGINKAQAVFHTLHEPITSIYPSTTLRRHPDAILFLDEESASIIEYFQQLI